MSEWILVKNNVPKDSEEYVLVYLVNGIYQIAKYNKSKYLFIMLDNGWILQENVVCWMHLPEPPTVR